MLKVKLGLVFSAAILLSACAGQMNNNDNSNQESSSHEGSSQKSADKKAGMTLDQQMELFNQWFTGEFDNHEQVWLEKGLKAKNVHEHIHHVFAPVSAPNIGDNTYFIKQYMDGDATKVYRQRLYSFTKNEAENALLLTIYSFNDAKKYADGHLNEEIFAALTKDQLRTIPGCEVFWSHNGEYFDGFMKEKACHFKSKRSGKEIYITDDLRLTDNEIWIRDVAHDEDGNYVFGNKDGIHHKNRKVKYFEGWAGVKAKGMDATKADTDWHFMSGFKMHNEGQIVELVNGKTGEKTGYSISLSQLTYQNTKTPILKLGLIDNKTSKTIRYIWANTDAEKIGLNFGWVQVGLTRKTEDMAIGYTKK